MRPDWLMGQFSDLVPNGMQQVPGIHFQHAGPAVFRDYSSAGPPVENPNCHLATCAVFYARLASQSVPFSTVALPPLVPFISSLGFGLLPDP
jgi:hypothetical protein